MKKKTKRAFAPALSIVGMFALLLSAGLFASCSEDKGTTDEFAQWQSKNDAYWDQLYHETQQKIAGGDTSWRIILNYSQDGTTSTDGSPLTHGKNQYIIVHTLALSNCIEHPMYTDSVLVHYQGRLIPSPTYTAGLVFDSSWGAGAFDAQTARMRGLMVSKVVDGFATALQAMHLGDHFVVYIPYRLGYGNKMQGKVPGCSDLIFDLRLAKIFRK